MGQQQSMPETSQECYEIADRLKILAEAEEENFDGIASAMNAANYRRDEIKYRQQGNELRKLGK